MNDVFLRLPEVKKITGVKKGTIYKQMKNGSFPKQVRISDSAVGWLESEIHRWQQEKISQRNENFMR